MICRQIYSAGGDDMMKNPTGDGTSRCSSLGALEGFYVLYRFSLQLIVYSTVDKDLYYGLDFALSDLRAMRVAWVTAPLTLTFIPSGFSSNMFRVMT